MVQLTPGGGMRRWLIIVLCMLLMGIGLVACGTQSPAQSTTASSNASPASQQVQKCGFVIGRGELNTAIKQINAPQTENCFWLNFQQCHPASLVFITSGLHAGSIHTFTIHKGANGCFISDAMQIGTSPASAGPATTYTCTGLIRQPNALEVLNCGKEGTISVIGA